MDGHIMRCGTMTHANQLPFRDCKALLVTSLTHVSGAIASVQTFTFTFTMCNFYGIEFRRDCKLCCSLYLIIILCTILLTLNFMTRDTLSINQSMLVTINPLVGTATDHCTAIRRLIGTLAVEGWAVTFGTASRGIGELRPRSVLSSLYQM